MEKFPALFPRLLSPVLLAEAFSRVCENAGAPGADGETVEMFGRERDANLGCLLEELRTGTYQPRPLLLVAIHKPSGGMRELCIPSVRDRVVQTAATLLLAPILEANEFEPVSYAYRPGRSVQMALAEVLRHRDAGYEWLLDADINGFFDHIDHGLLLAKLARHVPEESFLQLVLEWIKGDVIGPDGPWCLDRGVPQGSPISPLLANLYLDELDEAIQEDFPMVRYADDFVVLARSEDEAKSARMRIIDVLTGLKLTLNAEKTRIVHFDEGFSFLGARFLGDAMWLEWRDGHSISRKPAPRRREPSEHGQAAFQRSRPPANRAMADALTRALGQRAATGEDGLPGQALAAERHYAAVPSGPIPTSGHEPRLRTLHVTEPGCYLAHQADRIVVKKGEEVLRDLPAAYVDMIVIAAHGVMSTPFMRFCCERGITIGLMDGQGQWHGLLAREPLDRIAIQRAQFLKENDIEFARHLACAMTQGKLANSRTMLRRYARRRHMPQLLAAISTLDHSVRNALSAPDLDTLRGVEGAGAAAYFGALRALLAEAGWRFGPRSRPAADPFNAALNYGYSILLANVAGLMQTNGLSPYIGFLHSARQGHPAGASDVMEEFRAVAVDAVLLAVFLRKRVTDTDFENSPNGVRISLSARRVIIHAIESRFNAPVEGRNGDTNDLRRHIDSQAAHLVAVLTGKTKEYRAFRIR